MKNQEFRPPPSHPRAGHVPPLHRTTSVILYGRHICRPPIAGLRLGAWGLPTLPAQSFQSVIPTERAERLFVLSARSKGGATLQAVIPTGAAGGVEGSMESLWAGGREFKIQNSKQKTDVVVGGPEFLIPNS